jgi:hypothetical protein
MAATVGYARAHSLSPQEVAPQIERLGLKGVDYIFHCADLDSENVRRQSPTPSLSLFLFFLSLSHFDFCL